jgi:hypothetical protein
VASLVLWDFYAVSWKMDIFLWRIPLKRNRLPETDRTIQCCFLWIWIPFNGVSCRLQFSFHLNQITRTFLMTSDLLDEMRKSDRLRKAWRFSKLLWHWLIQYTSNIVPCLMYIWCSQRSGIYVCLLLLVICHLTNRFIIISLLFGGERYSVLGWGTMLQAGRSRVRPDEVDFFQFT